jgi:FtsH-binding integral membrane protein
MIVAATVAGAVFLAVRLRAWRNRRALGAVLIIVTGSVVGGTVLAIAARFYCARLYPAYPLTFDIVSSALILAAVTRIARLRRRRRS